MSEGGPVLQQQASQARLSVSTGEELGADAGGVAAVRAVASGPVVLVADAPAVVEQQQQQVVQGDEDEVKEPEPKRFKSEGSGSSLMTNEYKLEERLNGILCCAVCLDLPNLTIYQVSPCDVSTFNFIVSRPISYDYYYRQFVIILFVM